MNREILFLGKRTKKGEWIQGLPFGCIYGGFSNGAICSIKKINEKYGDIYDVIPETVGQYTGLTDKNGKKIFEGDIVKGLFNFGLSINAKVVYYDGSFGVVCKRCGAINFTAFPSFCGVDWEVIGNIYDNPELMEERE